MSLNRSDRNHYLKLYLNGWKHPNHQLTQLDKNKTRTRQEQDKSDNKKPQPSKDTTIFNLDELPGIQPQDTLDNIGNNRKLYCDLVIMFKNTELETANEIKNYLESKNWKQALQLSHTLKGSSVAIGANALSQCAAEMEKYCKDKDDIKSLQFLPQLIEAFHIVINGIIKQENS